MHYIPLPCTSSPCNLLFLNPGVYGLVQAAVGVGTVLIWNFCVAYTKGGGVGTEQGLDMEGGPIEAQMTAQQANGGCSISLHRIHCGGKLPMWQLPVHMHACLPNAKLQRTSCRVLDCAPLAIHRPPPFRLIGSPEHTHHDGRSSRACQMLYCRPNPGARAFEISGAGRGSYAQIPEEGRQTRAKPPRRSLQPQA